MSRHPDIIAWEEWLNSEEGRDCSEARSLGIKSDHQTFLENRLWRAFMAGRRHLPAPKELQEQ